MASTALLEFAGPARPTGRFRLENAANAGTKVTTSLESQPRDPSQLLSPLIRTQMGIEVAALGQLARQFD